MMAKYIEREEAKEAAMDSCELYQSECDMIGCAVDKIPAADVAPVVRCKDCENKTTYKIGSCAAFGSNKWRKTTFVAVGSERRSNYGLH